MFLRPWLANHARPASSPSVANTATASFHVARPHNTPLKVEPASFAKRSVSWNNSAETPALKKMNGRSVISDCSLNKRNASSRVYTGSTPSLVKPSTKFMFTGTSTFNTSTL